MESQCKYNCRKNKQLNEEKSGVQRLQRKGTKRVYEKKKEIRKIKVDIHRE